MAGLYELWRDPTRADDDPDRWRWTCTVITTDAEDDLGRIHDRMPLMLTPDRYDAWLDPDNHDPDSLLGLLQPASPGLLEAYPVSTLVSNVANNGPDLVEPLPLDESAGRGRRLMPSERLRADAARRRAPGRPPREATDGDAGADPRRRRRHRRP